MMKAAPMANRLLLVTFCICIPAFLVKKAQALVTMDESCGGFKEVANPTETGVLASPGHPGSYNILDLCIWLIQAPEDYAVRLSVDGVAGETNDTHCVDYLEVRSGSPKEALLYIGCDTSSSAIVTSQGRWLWARFHSNYENTNKGFTAKWDIVSSPENANSSTDVFQECQNQRYTCPNKECTTWAYRCDGQNDCGCLQTGCDEINCAGFDIGTPMKLGMGVGLGSAILILVFLGVGLLDILQKRLVERRYRQRLERQRRLKKQRKAKAMAQLFVQRPSFSLSNGSGGDDGGRLSMASGAPSARTSISMSVRGSVSNEGR